MCNKYVQKCLLGYTRSYRFSNGWLLSVKLKTVSTGCQWLRFSTPSLVCDFHTKWLFKDNQLIKQIKMKKKLNLTNLVKTFFIHISIWIWTRYVVAIKKKKRRNKMIDTSTSVLLREYCSRIWTCVKYIYVCYYLQWWP